MAVAMLVLSACGAGTEGVDTQVAATAETGTTEPAVVTVTPAVPPSTVVAAADATVLPVETVPPTVPSTPAPPAPAGPSCDPSVISTDLGASGVEVIEGLCLDGWAYVETCVGAECGDSQVLLRHDAMRWGLYTAFPSPKCRSEVLDAGAPIAIVDRINWACDAPVPAAAPTPAGALVLRPGDSGELVRRLQQELRDRGYAVDLDGQFGPGTEAAVREEQRDVGVEADGLVGPQTRAAFGIGDATASPYRSTAEFVNALIARLNGDRSVSVPADAVVAIGEIDIPGVDWTAQGAESGPAGRTLTSIVYSGEGGVYLYGQICTRPAADGTIAWCGLWNLAAHG